MTTELWKGQAFTASHLDDAKFETRLVEAP